MNIHILTLDPTTDERLRQLLEALSQTCIIHSELDALVKASKRLDKQSAVFYDLRLENKLWAFERLYTSCKRTNLVGFEPLTEDTANGGQHCVEGVEHYILLPKNEVRAKTRIQEVLRAIRQKAVAKKRASATRAKKRSDSAATTKAVQGTEVASAATPAAVAQAPAGQARYLHAQSSVMQRFLGEMLKRPENGVMTVIEGEDGAEFELAARELNFISNRDQAPLLCLDPMLFCGEELRRALGAANERKKIQYCYLGLSADITGESAQQLERFLDEYRKSEAPFLKLVMGHVQDSQSYFAAAAIEVIAELRKDADVLKLPPMNERSEDVEAIVQTVFSNLRMAHPFFHVRNLAPSAINLFRDECEQMDYSRIVRTLRNALALSQHPTLTDEEIRNFWDNSTTTQHLIESLADEKFFQTDEDEDLGPVRATANDVA